MKSEEHLKKLKAIHEVLAAHGIQIHDVIPTSVGPSFSQFRVTPLPGKNLSRVRLYADDIARADINRLWEHSQLNELHEKFSERTFHHHRDAIEEMFGIRILCDRSQGYYIANQDDWENDGIQEWLLESMAMNDLVNETSDMRDRILFENVPSSEPWLSIIVNAMRDEKAVELTYQSFNREEPNSFEVHPWCLKLFRQRWYMLARSEGYLQPRIYALDQRMRNVVPLKKKLRKPAMARLLPSSPSKSGQTRRSTWKRSPCIRLIPTFDFKQELLSRGSAVQVLSPGWLRTEMEEEIGRMLSSYRENGDK